MATITIEVTDTELKAMEYVAADPVDWADNAVTNRARIAIDEIVEITVKHCLDKGVQVPATREAIVVFAYENGLIMTAAQRNKETLAQPGV
jgi:hypothetical protein